MTLQTLHQTTSPFTIPFFCHPERPQDKVLCLGQHLAVSSREHWPQTFICLTLAMQTATVCGEGHRLMKLKESHYLHKSRDAILRFPDQTQSSPAGCTLGSRPWISQTGEEMRGHGGQHHWKVHWLCATNTKCSSDFYYMETGRPVAVLRHMSHIEGTEQTPMLHWLLQSTDPG